MSCSSEAGKFSQRRWSLSSNAAAFTGKRPIPSLLLCYLPFSRRRRCVASPTHARRAPGSAQSTPTSCSRAHSTVDARVSFISLLQYFRYYMILRFLTPRTDLEIFIVRFWLQRARAQIDSRPIVIKKEKRAKNAKNAVDMS